jgi:hypothetical protein
MSPAGKDRSPEFKSRMTAAQVFASLNEERGNDPWLQTGAPAEPGRRGESVERRGPY